MDILQATQNGANFTLTPLFNFNTIKMMYIATQGDRLQVFLLELSSTITVYTTATVPFDYLSRVKFDTANLPDQVGLGVFLAGFQTAATNMKVSIWIFPIRNLA